MNLKIFTNAALLILSLILGTATFGKSQTQIVYKQIDTFQLRMEIYTPKNAVVDAVYPAMIFFFGGGWNGGKISQFELQAKHFSEKGIVCFLADYRVKKTHGTTPFESLKDAKSAIRFIKKNHTKFQIDPSKIIAAGGSAGGHLAAATALIPDYNSNTDDMTISAIPDALVLFNPVIDNGPGGYGFERVGVEYKKFSPLHNIKKGAPPTIFFLGTKDKLIPVETARYYQKVMEKVGSKCDLKLYKRQEHGFFNYSKSKKSYKSTVKETEKFLISLGYIED